MTHQTSVSFATVVLLTAVSFQPVLAADKDAAGSQRPNVLFIAVDDLNDWVGCLGGHPQALTPHIDRLAKAGTNFANAHCQAPICNPSRVSLLTGKLPSSTGVYYLAPGIRDCPETRPLVTLPQHFQQNGYHTLGAGKIFHTGGGGEFKEFAARLGGFGPVPPRPLSAGQTHPLWDWGAYPERDKQMPDARLANWAAGKLAGEYDKPFFLAVGFFRPHVPLYAPQDWFDQFPADIQLPAFREDDLNDVPQYGQDLSWSRLAPRHKWIVEHDEWRHAVRAYLACISFVDAQVGKVLDALQQSRHADNTIVVLWSDHGFHLGTKERWGKRSLWEDATRVVLVVSGPGIAANQTCGRPVGLVDLYPTLIDLCDLAAREGLDGRSLTPLLKDAATPWPWPAITTFGQNNHAVRSDQYRYIRYADGTEELYDHQSDPDEFDNLAGDPRFRQIAEELRGQLPAVNLPMAPGSKHADARPGSPADIDP